ncbi:MAG TPA: aminotransferase class I/II-fold pyridoxal phosphate-dependent enzyme [Rubricoccaceae bacterium]|nr:aminotransferase class I/II-fold pyridoxal phosphate-dependent enzyme [Rubricoccaceae bacterium]
MTLPDLHGVPQPTPTPAAATPASEEAPPRKALFDKAQRFLDPAGDYVQVKAADLYPYFRPIEVSEGSRAVMHGREVIMAGSNNYLGLTNHPKVVEAAQAAIAKYGTGCTGSRFLNGTLDLHLELEDRLARFMGKEGCVLFSTGYMTNQGVIQSLAGKGDLVFSDKDNHACIVAGTQVSMAETIRYRHDDMAHLRLLLEKYSRERPEAGKLIVTDGVFSMSGTLARVPELVALADEFGAALMLDDAHAVGVVGEGGRGSASAFGLLDRVDLTTGTFSKSFASLGGFIVGSYAATEYIRHTSSAHIFSASMPPANVATVLACLDLLEEEPWRLARLAEISERMRTGFRDLGFDVWTSQTPIIPVVVGDMVTCFKFWKDLLEEGVFVNAVIPPAVPPGQALMRTSYMATHTDDELDHILDAFHKVGLKHGVIGRNGQPGHLIGRNGQYVD